MKIKDDDELLEYEQYFNYRKVKCVIKRRVNFDNNNQTNHEFLKENHTDAEKKLYKSWYYGYLLFDDDNSHLIQYRIIDELFTGGISYNGSLVTNEFSNKKQFDDCTHQYIVFGFSLYQRNIDKYMLINNKSSNMLSVSKNDVVNTLKTTIDYLYQNQRKSIFGD